MADIAMHVARDLPRRAEEPRRWLAPAAAIGGGATIVVGTLLPWLTLFAGLHSYRGFIGWNGRLMMAGGVLCLLAGLGLLLRNRPWVRRGIATLGLCVLVAAGWLIVQQQAMLRSLLSDQPMTVPSAGPGLYVVAAGALLACLVPFLAVPGPARFVGSAQRAA